MSNENAVLQRIKIWREEKDKIRLNQCKNHLINLEGDMLICTVVIQELEELFNEIKHDSIRDKSE